MKDYFIINLIIAKNPDIIAIQVLKIYAWL